MGHTERADDPAEDSESKCGSSHNKLSSNSQQLLLLQHLIEQQRQQQESHRLIEAEMRRREQHLGNQDAGTANQGGESKPKP